MPDASNRLGGFKVLKEMGEISLVLPEGNDGRLAELLHAFSLNSINLPFLICDNQQESAGLYMTVETGKTRQTARLLQGFPGLRCAEREKRAILSLFPHRNDPHIAAALLQSFGEKNIPFHALAHSQSAISAVLRESALNRAAGALFEPFQFGAYRTPADWKLAQEGKEELHKEIVASYQEKKPRVYCLEWQHDLTLLQVIFHQAYYGAMGLIFEDLARTGFNLSFLITSPPRAENEARLLFCIRRDLKDSLVLSAKKWLPDATLVESPSVALFSMNGPHFGDRHGLAYELFEGLANAKVPLLALSCSIASISGVVFSGHIEKATDAIQKHFEVPAVIRKGQQSD